MFEKNHRGYVDSHVHVWTNDVQNYGLATGVTTQEMKPAVFLPEELWRHAEPAGVDRALLIQMSYYGYDNSYMLDVIAQSPEVFRGIAIVDWNAKAPEVRMRDLARKGVRGFRIYPERGCASTWLDSEGFERMFRCGAEENLALCPLINPDALLALDRQCRRFGDTPVVVDHLARIGTDASIKEPDVRALCALAKYPQVRLKVSAFYGLGQAKPPHIDLAPLIRRAYYAFGPDRLMWGSDCPFQLMAETYENSISLIRDHLDFLSRADKDWILRKTAEKLFFD